MSREPRLSDLTAAAAGTALALGRLNAAMKASGAALLNLIEAHQASLYASLKAERERRQRSS